MRNKKTLSISEARKNIFEIAEEVQKPESFYTLTEKGVPKAVIMSADQFDSLMEDLEMASDPQTLANIRKAEAEHARGEYVTWDELKKELGLVNYKAIMVGEKPSRPYRVKKSKPPKKQKREGK